MFFQKCVARAIHSIEFAFQIQRAALMKFIQILQAVTSFLDTVKQNCFLERDTMKFFLFLEVCS